MTTGYSGTPLAKKLGIKSKFRIKLLHQPGHYFSLFTDMPADVTITDDADTRKDLIHYFTKSAAQLEGDILKLREEMEENGMIWVSWPKRSSGVATDVTEHSIREIALKNGLVDVKVCAVDDTWSGLKLVIRLKDRK